MTPPVNYLIAAKLTWNVAGAPRSVCPPVKGFVTFLHDFSLRARPLFYYLLPVFSRRSIIKNSDSEFAANQFCSKLLYQIKSFTFAWF